MTLSFRFVIGAVILVVASTLVFAGLMLRCGGLVMIGLAQSLSAISALGHSGHTPLGNRLFSRLLGFAWLVCSAGAVQVLIRFIQVESTRTVHPLGATILLALSLFFLAVAQLVRAKGEEENESRFLIMIIYEMMVISLIGSFVLRFEHSAVPLVARLEGLIGIWTVALGVDGVIRMALAFLDGGAVTDELGRTGIIRSLAYGLTSSDEQSVSPVADFKSRGGVFLANQRLLAIGSLVFLLACAWLLRGVIIVNPHERVVCFQWGHLEPLPLGPGLHFRIPSPFSRVEHIAVHSLHSCPIGFEATESDFRSKPLLWTAAHGQSEAAFMIGDGTELVAINAVVIYRITSDPSLLPAYVTSSIDPEALLKLTANRLLTVETRTATLDQLLEKDLEAWNTQLADKLQTEINDLVPGMDVVSFRVLSVHPPIAVAASFLDHVNARIDAEKSRMEARGSAVAETFRSEMMSKSVVADAKGAASKRLTVVVDEAAHLAALSNLDRESPEVVRRRLYCEAMVEALEHKSITVLDAAIPSDLRLSLGENLSVTPNAPGLLEGR